MIALNPIGPHPYCLAALLGALLMVCASAFGETLQGRAGCGTFSVERQNGVFSARLCNDRWQANGRYDAADIHVDSVATGTRPFATADWSYPAASWTETLQRLSSALDALGATLAQLDNDGTDLSGFTRVSAGPTPLCNDGAGGFHILDGRSRGSFHIGAGCVAVAAEAVHVDTVWVEGVLSSRPPIEARALLVTGGRLVASALAAGRLSLNDGEVRSTEIQVQGLEAERGRLLVGGTLKVSAPQHQGGAEVRLDDDSALSATEIQVDAMTARNGAQVLVANTLQGGKLVFEGARLSAAEVQTETLISDGGKLSIGHLQAAEGIDLGSSQLQVETLATRRLDASDSELIGAEIQGGVMRVESSTITAAGEGDRLTLRADDLDLVASDIKGGRRCEIHVSGRSAFRETRVEAAHIDATLGEAGVDKQSVFHALPVAPFRSRQVIMDDGESTADVSGASHGGYGGTAGSLAGNRFIPAEEPVGDPRLEEPLAGRGGWGLARDAPPLDSSTGGAGGGTLVVRADHLDWQAAGSADGGMAPPHGIAGTPFLRWGGGGGGGAGGSIIVEVAGRLSGGGSFQANGGAGTYGIELGHFSGGGGGGGRIRIAYGDKTGWHGKASARGGAGARYNPDTLNPSPASLPWSHRLNHGGPGTVYWKPAAGAGTLVIEGRNGLGGVSRLSGDFSGDDVVVAGAVVTTSGLKVRNLRLEDGALLTADNPRVRLQWPLPTAYPVPKGHAVHALRGADNRYPQAVAKAPLEARVEVVVRNRLEIDAASAIDVSGFGGYSRGEIQGDRSGGSHGGIGGHGGMTAIRVPAAASYGDPSRPFETGAGGAGAHGLGQADPAKCALGGAGGGALRLVVGATLTLDGALLADGQAGMDETGCGDVQGTGGGAGGSVWITAGTVVGTGIVSARGGRGGMSEGAVGGGGGGGRIALYHSLGRLEGTMLVDGGVRQDAPPQAEGRPGSVVTGGAADADGDGILDDFDALVKPNGDDGGGGEGLVLGLMVLITRMLAWTVSGRPAQEGSRSSSIGS